MLCLPDYNKPYLIESLTAPIVIKHYWTFDAQLCDFVLRQIHYLEETTGPAVKARINNFEFWIPATWQILVTDTDTYQLDTVNIQSCANIKHTAFAFSPKEMKLKTVSVYIVDYAENISVVHPMIQKSTALVHPVGPELQTINNIPPAQLSVVIGPNDLYKQISNKVVGDLFIL